MKTSKKSRLYRHIGNFFIIISLVGFGLVFIPFLISYLPREQEAIDRSSSVFIPKINAYAPVIYNVDPFDAAVYKKALTQGVAHAKGSSVPGSPGTVYLFAHSSGLPWEMTRYNTIFLRLNELNQGDKIYVYKDGKEYIYSVENKKEVWPQEVSYLVDSAKNDQLILQTCSPIGTDLKRLLVFASPAL